MPSPERVRDFVVAAHGDLEGVRRMLEEEPELLHQAHEWGPGDRETAIQAAAHTGQRAIAEYLLAKGALLEVPTAAMLGDVPQVERMLSQDPGLVRCRGAHGIPLLPHAALSGRPEMLALVWARGAREGVEQALRLAVLGNRVEAVRWLLEKAAPELGSSPGGRTLLERAVELGHQEIVALLKARLEP
ncbi:MAG: ankyrin repeat domain-containing protein [Meiothermus sp.]|uniref:ankyrin repeat domain-containing protein n=1 Tax=Meiothermus sp. TaxID=1955249 RepID=UPI0025E7D38F|nr:ankyrin repeat domain-containing protein [Meiothermus sp.]MCS7057380.1 ankyrin repeat domain-containing protein [Meiothermus sp.]MCS7193615.1 ankyrin repeat domain-containing protein [Meiothermus sp.]MCX7741094.1 ankyrin repeat domain-containing protein [Meiothermus sp.]MDW8090629.1 ankyrin repeat domain-containing protein [Meiothermus sp.]MDW8480545.1 ankyrin repeat domain-containing protein [Meiothermus sp.]